jgi:hypothetical protein
VGLQFLGDHQNRGPAQAEQAEAIVYGGTVEAELLEQFVGHRGADF